MPTHPWSKLQRLVYQVVSPEIKFQIHCCAYPMHSPHGTADVPRYWITLGKNIIWDYPKDFVSRKNFFSRYYPFPFPYGWDVSEISCLIREYLDTPRRELLAKPFEQDIWGIVDILRSADRRIGSRRWDEIEQKAQSKAVTTIIAQRRSLHATTALHE